MEYKITIYKESEDKKSRFVLGTKGSNTLFVIGVNPSVADENFPDPTIRKIMGFAEKNAFDSFVMLNLYPQRATNPNDLDIKEDEVLTECNIKEIRNVIQNQSNATILVAWGNLISKRKYLISCFEKIYKALQDDNVKWIKIGDLTQSKNPRHPLYASYNMPFSDFDIHDYIHSNVKRLIINNAN